METGSESGRRRTATEKPTPPSAFRSLSKKSLNDVVNDLNEISRHATPTISTLPARSHARHIEWSPSVEQPPVQRAPHLPLLDLHAAYSPLDSGYRDHDSSYREKTPLTVSAEQEVQEILGGHRSRQLPSFRRNVTSAPDFARSEDLLHGHRAIAGQIDEPHARQSDQPRGSHVHVDHEHPAAVRRAVGHAVRRRQAAAPAPLLRAAAQESRSCRPIRTPRGSPSLLRSSNLHSRTYFRPQTSESPPSFPRSFPYRSRLGATVGSTGSPLFDSFASVKRSRGIDESRSLSPSSAWEPPVQPPNARNKPLLRCVPAAVGTQTPPQPPRSLRDSPTQTPPLPPVKKITPVHSGSQTTRVYSKNISVETTPLDRSSVALDTADLQPPSTETDALHRGHKAREKRGRRACRPSLVSSMRPPRAARSPPSSQTQTDEPPARPPPSIEEATTQTDSDWLMAEVRELLRAEKAERKSADKKTETEEEEAGEFILITCAKCNATCVDSPHEQYEKIRDDDLPPHPSSTRPLHSSTLKSSSSSSDPDEGLELIEPLDYETEAAGGRGGGRRSHQSARSTRVHLAASTRAARTEGGGHPLVALQSFGRPLAGRGGARDFGQLGPPDRPPLAEQPRSPTASRWTPTPRRSSASTRTPTRPNGSSIASRTEAIRKLLTEPTRSNAAFQRESAANRSYRVDKSKAHDLDYILDKHTATEKSTAEPSTPSHDPEKALTEMVVLKKFVSLPSQFPDPVPARIPRPKFAKRPDEAAEEADKLTPLRSELQYPDSWRGGMRNRRFRHHQYPTYSSDPHAAGGLLGRRRGNAPDRPERAAHLLQLLAHFRRGDGQRGGRERPVRVDPAAERSPWRRSTSGCSEGKKEDELEAADWATRYTQHQWFNITTKKAASAHSIERFIDALEALSPQLMETVVNFVDQNGNSALHYVVSHENFDAISVLLDAKVCRVDETNKAGYSPVMLGALCAVKDETEGAIVQRLFERGDVNKKAVFHGQTALMLACSHGRVQTTKLLLDSGADDIDGSTALMCAAEHGHKELVRALLNTPNIDCSLTDCDDQTALSIAVENGHRDIGVLIYAHLNFSRMEQHESSGKRRLIPHSFLLAISQYLCSLLPSNEMLPSSHPVGRPRAHTQRPSCPLINRITTRGRGLFNRTTNEQ
ncbi:KN motif and ankyrin repeat domain-containing protein 1 [Aphelenchoides fujianensis]|nr:KN motif and ankyrin repeat domain-containing protein 1 [Aphelenchoides fujianensis]